MAAVAPASKTQSFWCGFTQIQHHEILHCGFMYGCRCKDINSCTFCRYMWRQVCVCKGKTS